MWYGHWGLLNSYSHWWVNQNRRADNDSRPCIETRNIICASGNDYKDDFVHVRVRQSFHLQNSFTFFLWHSLFMQLMIVCS